MYMKKMNLLILLGGLLLAGCDEPTGTSSRMNVEDGGDPDDVAYSWMIVREDGSSALEGDNVIWRDSEPSRLTLKVKDDGWENPEWYVDDGESPAETGASLTLYARFLRDTLHHITFLGFRQGIPYSVVIPVTVSAGHAADIVWMQTENDSSFTEFDFGLDSWTGYGERVETWNLRAAESSRVYFAVRKREIQTITVEGEHRDKVTKAAIGTEVDGSEAAPALDVFTVDTGDVETLFGGGERSFTLRVKEPGKDDKTVLVNLEVLPRLTGAAIFAVSPEGGLKRITADNVETYANDLYRQHTALPEFPSWGIAIDNVTGLAGALKWLDSYAASGEAGALKEYLVRVEKNEVMDQTALTGYGDGLLVHHIKVRLRGYGAERSISHDVSKTTNNSYSKVNNIKIYNAFFCIGLYRNSSGDGKGVSNITLQLEENITIDAAGGADQNFPESIVAVGDSCTFVMENGSKLTNYRGRYSSEVHTSGHPVDLMWDGRFEMRGGEISNCKWIKCAVFIAASNSDGSTFLYYDGTFRDNDSNLVCIEYSNYKHYEFFRQ